MRRNAVLGDDPIAIPLDAARKQCCVWEHGGVSVRYLLSDSAAGHGDVVWASGVLLGRLIVEDSLASAGLARPLAGCRVLELGAGSGLPSWACLHRGCRVVVTDLPDAERIGTLCIAARLNIEQLEAAAGDREGAAPSPSDRVRVAPFLWGSDPSDVLAAHGGGGYDLVLAADCIYNPAAHAVLLASIASALLGRPVRDPEEVRGVAAGGKEAIAMATATATDSDAPAVTRASSGVALVPYALHGNVRDEDVEAFFVRAADWGLNVLRLGSWQLEPTNELTQRDRRRARVHLVSLSW